LTNFISILNVCYTSFTNNLMFRITKGVCVAVQTYSVGSLFSRYSV